MYCRPVCCRSWFLQRVHALNQSTYKSEYRSTVEAKMKLKEGNYFALYLSRIKFQVKNRFPWFKLKSPFFTLHSQFFSSGELRKLTTFPRQSLSTQVYKIRSEKKGKALIITDIFKSVFLFSQYALMAKIVILKNHKRESSYFFVTLCLSTE